MDVSPIIARLQAQATGFVVIAGAADLDAAIDSSPTPPAAYVIPLAEQATASDITPVVSQRVVSAFGIVIVVANVRDVAGAAAAADLVSRRAAVRTALLGWVPDAATGEPIEFGAGRLLQFRDARLWWTDEYRLITYVRSA